jgi:hypothetical protein
MLGAAGVGGVGCGRFGATVVLHTRCTPKITHHLGSPGGHNVSASHDHVQTGAPRRGAAAWSVMSLRGDRQYRVGQRCGGLPGGLPPVSRPATRGRRTSARPAASGASTLPKHRERLTIRGYGGVIGGPSPHRKDAYRARPAPRLNRPIPCPSPV